MNLADLNETQLKALGYDLVVSIEQHRKLLDAVQREIAERESTPKDTEAAQ